MRSFFSAIIVGAIMLIVATSFAYGEDQFYWVCKEECKEYACIKECIVRKSTEIAESKRIAKKIEKESCFQKGGTWDDYHNGGSCTIPDPKAIIACDCLVWAEKHCKSVLIRKTNCSPITHCWWMPLTRQWYCEKEIRCWEDYKAVCNEVSPKNTHVYASDSNSLYCTVGNDNTMYDNYACKNH